MTDRLNGARIAARTGQRGLRRICVATVVLATCGCSQPGLQPEPDPVALHVAPAGVDGPFAVAVGTALQLNAVRVRKDSTRVGNAISASWSSSSPAIATVNTEGLVQTHCVGTAIITATVTEAGRQLSGTRAVSVVTGGPSCVP
jgi:hypothetical protein